MYLSERAVDPEFALYSEGVRTVTAEEGARLLGFSRPLVSSGLFIPYANVGGYARVRLDDDGTCRVPVGREVPVYIPRDCQRRGETPLFVTEGPIKALAMMDVGFNTIALGGVTTTLTGEHKLNNSWADVALCDRDVFIVFDANRQTNVEVARAEARLVLALERAGARVRVVALPLLDGGEDQGPDDFLAAHGHEPGPLRSLVAAASPGDPVVRASGVVDREGALSLLEDLPFLLAVHERGAVVVERLVATLAAHKVTRTLLRKALKAALERGRRARVTDSAAARYEVRNGCLCLVLSDGVTERVEPLANFTAEVVEERILDDGSRATSHVFVLEGALEDGTPLPLVSVSPKDFIGELWPLEKWGTRVTVSAGMPRSAHHLRNAISAVSTATQHVVAYTHTGFRQREGDLFYLHGGGAVGASGVTVALDGPAARFVLPDVATDVMGAVNESLEFMRVANARITYPVHAAIYRAPLSEAMLCDAVLGLYGPTGALKSALAAVAQSHFGDFDYNSLPLNWESTANSLEAELFRLKDVFVTIDEFVPAGGLYDELQKKAERVFRAIANGSSRGRLYADLSSRPERPCRGLVAMTGEDIPRGESIQARLVAIRLARGEVDCDRLGARQRGRSRLPHAMKAYVDWLLPRMLQLKADVRKKYTAFREELHGNGHLRAPSAMAHLLVGAFYFAEFAKHIGLMTSAEAVAHVETTREALLANAQEQVRATEQSDPAKRFMDVLRALYARGAIALKAVGESLRPYNDASAMEVGWKDDILAYIEVNVISVAVNKELAGMNERQPLQAHGLWKRMAAEGFIVPNGDEMTPKFRGDGRTRVRVLRVPLSKLLGPGSDPGGGGGRGDGDHERDDADDRDPYVDREAPLPDDVEPPSTPLRPFRAPYVWPANTQSAQGPKSCPEVSELLGRVGANDNLQSNPQVEVSLHEPMEGSAQEPKSMGESRIEDLETRTPRVGPRENKSIFGASLSYGNSWALGPEGGDPIGEAIIRSGEVGLAVGGGGSPFVALAVPGGETTIIGPPISAPMRAALARVTVVGHDLKGALTVLRQHGVQPARVFDTMLAWRLYDGGQHNDESYFAFKNAWRTHFEAEPPSYPDARAQVEEEARAVLEFEPVLRAKLAEDGLEEVAVLEFALLPIVAEMEATGVAIDAAAWKRVTSTWKTEATRLRRTLTTGLGVKNVDDDKQVLVALRRLGFAVERTSGEILAQYSDNPVVAQLVQYRRISGFVRSSGKAVLEALARSPDGRVRTTLHQLGARTGRMSCSEPNLMGLPRDEQVRGCITVPSGRKLIIGDYKAIEMRVIADQPGDEQLRQVFATPGRCPHRHTATVLLPGKSEETVTEDEKNQAKPVNFGLCFGMSSRTLVPYARKNFKVVMSELQAEEFKKRFLDHYEGVRNWQNKTAQEMPSQLRTRSGRVSYYLSSDEGYNARLSFPVQGTAADGMKAAIVLLHPKLARLGAHIVLVVHDELIVEAPEEYAEEVMALMREAMVAGMKKYVPTVPIEVDIRVASSWAKTPGKGAS